MPSRDASDSAAPSVKLRVAEARRALAGIGPAQRLAVGREGRLLGDDRPDGLRPGPARQDLVIVAHDLVGRGADRLVVAHLRRGAAAAPGPRARSDRPGRRRLEDADLRRALHEHGLVEDVDLERAGRILQLVARRAFGTALRDERRAFRRRAAGSSRSRRTGPSGGRPASAGPAGRRGRCARACRLPFEPFCLRSRPRIVSSFGGRMDHGPRHGGRGRRDAARRGSSKGISGGGGSGRRRCRRAPAAAGAGLIPNSRSKKFCAWAPPEPAVSAATRIARPIRLISGSGRAGLRRNYGCYHSPRDRGPRATGPVRSGRASTGKRCAGR